MYCQGESSNSSSYLSRLEISYFLLEILLIIPDFITVSKIYSTYLNLSSFVSEESKIIVTSIFSVLKYEAKQGPAFGVLPVLMP